MGKTNARSVVWVVLVAGLLCVPLALLTVVGEAPHDFDGESDYQRPNFSAAGFWDGSFQTAFEHWFSTKYPLRPQIVEAYNRLDAWQGTVGFLPDAGGFRGTANVIVGLDGYLYENGYINEYYGYAEKYAAVTNGRAAGQAAVLKDIQDGLTGRGIAFCLLITPSKAAALPQYIPQWYRARFVADPSYVRPITRLKGFLQSEGVVYVDPAALYAGMDPAALFPKTSTHWTKEAALLAVNAVADVYGRQTGRATRRLAYDRLLTGGEPPGFGNSEKDIYGIVYAGRPGEEASAIADGAYYWPDAYVANPDLPDMGRVWVQGGSFADDVTYYLSEYGIARDVASVRYNNSGETPDWAAELEGAQMVVLEVNEQFAHNLGGNGPVFGNSDFTAQNPGTNILESLQAFLNSGGTPRTE